MNTISELSRSSFTWVTVAFFPSSVVAPPRAPPKRAVDDVLDACGTGLKAAAEATKLINTTDCFMVDDVCGLLRVCGVV